MAVLSAKKILDSLARARAVGQVEEAVTIAGIPLVLQSLRPEEYEVIHAETQEKEDVAYLNAYRLEHLCRSLMFVGELDFHDVSGVEVEVDEKDERTGQMVSKVITIEKHAFVRDYILATWSREAVDTAFRKFGDVVAKAERVSSDGVQFEVPDETDEEKYRRILLELREVEQKLPVELTARLLDEVGLSKKATSSDMAAAEERLGKLAAEAAKKESAENAKAAPVAPPTAAVRRPIYEQPGVVPAQATPAAPQPAPQAALSAADQVRQRVAAANPQPPPVDGPGTRAATPEQLARARGQGQSPAQTSRAQQIAEAEGELLPNVPAVQGGTEIPNELGPQPKLDPKGALSVIDPRPAGGVNPRFRPPPRL